MVIMQCRTANCSLRSKRFRRAFHRLEAFFAFWRRKNWGERNTVRPNFRAFKKRKMLQTCRKPYGNACYTGYANSYKSPEWIPCWRRIPCVIALISFSFSHRKLTLKSFRYHSAKAPLLLTLGLSCYQSPPRPVFLCPMGSSKAARRVEHVFWACRSASLIVSILKEPRKGEGRRRRKSHSQIKSRKRMVWLLRRVIKAV